YATPLSIKVAMKARWRDSRSSLAMTSLALCLWRAASAYTLPSGGLWLHEIKHDGFRIIARKDGPRVRLYSRPGNDLTGRFLLVREARSASAGHAASWCPPRRP